MTAGRVYVICTADGLYKIGFSTNVGKRMQQFKQACTLLHSIPTEDGLRTEQALHSLYSSQRVRGEWFNLSAADLANIHAKGCDCGESTPVTYTPSPYVPGTVEERHDHAIWLADQRTRAIRHCAQCRQPFEGIRTRLYCSGRCRIAAYRTRRAGTQAPADG